MIVFKIKLPVISLLRDKILKGLPRWLQQYRKCKRHRFHPGVRKIPWSRKYQPAPGFLPWQKSLAGYSPQGHKALDTTEHSITTTILKKKTTVLDDLASFFFASKFMFVSNIYICIYTCKCQCEYPTFVWLMYSLPF